MNATESANAIFLTNTLTGKKEPFVPLQPGRVTMYVCGPTVYDVSHLGHLRSAFVFDVIRRFFLSEGYQVVFVRNVTDVDDKIIGRAQQECRDDSSADIVAATRRIARTYAESYRNDMAAFGILPPDIEPLATEHIADMIDLIARLIAKEAAYVVDGDVYFRVRRFPSYGALSGQSIDQMRTGARIDPEGGKEDPLDFALWKRVKPGEPFWESPWGNGRPGWHIECSAMNTKYLGPTFDIHGGGRDLIFPHHENEIAQAEAATGQPFARYWLHNGLITVAQEKMAKSLGNYITIADILKKTSAEAVKILFLSCHYAHPLDFTWQRVQEAERAGERLSNFFGRVEALLRTHSGQLPEPAGAAVTEFREAFLSAMRDDFNTAQALAVLFNLLSFGNQRLADDTAEVTGRLRDVLAVRRLLQELGRIMGLFQLQETLPPQLAGMLMPLAAEPVFGLAFLPGWSVEQMLDHVVDCRRRLRAQRNFQAADRLREQLQRSGVIIEDSRDGTSRWLLTSPVGQLFDKT